MTAHQDARQLTHAYESWLGSQIPLVAADLTCKHDEMRTQEYRFLRGTYYLWLIRVAEVAPDVLHGAAVPLIGDLHVENFGTWRDAAQIRRWGINDLDELARGSWRLDLVRLATSAVLAPHIVLSPKDICGVVLEAWSTTTPQPAVALADHSAAHLRDLVPPFANASKFYAELAQLPAEDDVPAAVVDAAHKVAEPGWRPTWRRHQAGIGSLGHRRAVGVGDAADGRPHAREAKQLGPGSTDWAGSVADAAFPRGELDLYDTVTEAVHWSGGASRVGGWQIRDLAPDAVRIELSGLAKKDSERLLRSMAAATADVHGSDRAAYDLARAETAHDWGLERLQDVVHSLAKSVKDDFDDYRAHGS